jgi:hypothetical protein
MKTEFGATASIPRVHANQKIENRNYEVARALVIKAVKRGWSPTYKRFPVEKVAVFSDYVTSTEDYVSEVIRLTITCNTENKISFWELIFGGDTRFVKALWHSQWKRKRIILAGADDPIDLLGCELEKEGLIDSKRAWRPVLPKYIEDSNNMLEEDDE